MTQRAIKPRKNSKDEDSVNLAFVERSCIFAVKIDLKVGK